MRVRSCACAQMFLRLRLLFSARMSVRKAVLRTLKARKKERTYLSFSPTARHHILRSRPSAYVIFEFSIVVFVQGFAVCKHGDLPLLYLLVAQLVEELTAPIAARSNVCQLHALRERARLLFCCGS